ncbi:hypothetical protein ASPZODRAFT_130458 [Penicilliopsis zonata CBS 506.65]|uniref:Nuclear pore complex component n=1 Tax=Penicilliopsis zonata CBS 506.65 TaxID=1073090 RepID=A0A1L9SMV1_9EURO|nr:hypothetical protein ASPZODRAFT_130458 [Penicilliopsis zonata CBS 506.65]OJJ48433.1 hypothetical protein ASPZODRAFT_130458 [Penicilliopsis zonata CBS 506.65]
MASQPVPSTPKPPSAASEDTRTPGKWRHPRLNEIVQRQNAATFGDNNIRRLSWNGAALVATWVFGPTLKSQALRVQLWSQIPMYPDLSAFLLQVFFIVNILVALFPLFRPKDDLSDIPLTPTQRSLLGLDPTATTPLTPGTTYVTPPRYRLSSSRAASPASRSGSPLSANAGFSGRRVSTGGSSFSASTSPLLHKVASNGSRESGRRPSFGSPSPLRSSFGESTMAPATPTPAGRKRASLGLSNKWLYERSRRLSASNGVL